MQNACGQRSVTPAAPLYMKKVEMIIMPEIPKSDLHPSWVPEDANENFACSVMGGIDTKVNANSEEKVYDPNAVRRVPLRRKPTLDEIVKGVGEGNRVMLSKAITLIESNAPKDFDKAQRVSDRRFHFGR